MLYPTELRGQIAIFDYFSEYSELFCRFLFSVIPDSAEFHFRRIDRIFTVSLFRTLSKGDRSNYHLGGECSIQLSYGGKWRYLINLRNIRNFLPFSVFCDSGFCRISFSSKKFGFSLFSFSGLFQKVIDRTIT